MELLLCKRCKVEIDPINNHQHTFDYCETCAPNVKITKEKIENAAKLASEQLREIHDKR